MLSYTHSSASLVPLHSFLPLLLLNLNNWAAHWATPHFFTFNRSLRFLCSRSDSSVWLLSSYLLGQGFLKLVPTPESGLPVWGFLLWRWSPVSAYNPWGDVFQGPYHQAPLPPSSVCFWQVWEAWWKIKGRSESGIFPSCGCSSVFHWGHGSCLKPVFCSHVLEITSLPCAFRPRDIMARFSVIPSFQSCRHLCKTLLIKLPSVAL